MNRIPKPISVLIAVMTCFLLQAQKIDTKNHISHEDLAKGGTLTMKMDDQPNKKRGITPEDLPYSASFNR